MLRDRHGVSLELRKTRHVLPRRENSVAFASSVLKERIFEEREIEFQLEGPSISNPSVYRAFSRERIL